MLCQVCKSQKLRNYVNLGRDLNFTISGRGHYSSFHASTDLHRKQQLCTTWAWVWGSLSHVCNVSQNKHFGWLFTKTTVCCVSHPFNTKREYICFHSLPPWLGGESSSRIHQALAYTLSLMARIRKMDGWYRLGPYQSCHPLLKALSLNTQLSQACFCCFWMLAGWMIGLERKQLTIICTLCAHTDITEWCKQRVRLYLHIYTGTSMCTRDSVPEFKN